MTFVVSSRMGTPPTLDPVTRRLARYPNIRFKLDGTPDWTDELIDGLVKSGAVDSIDFKGAYKGTVVDVETDPAFYRRIAETFPDAWLEDPDLEDEDAMHALAPFQDRITWDAPIHSVDDILSRKVIPRTVNLKPSRFGSVKALFRPTSSASSAGWAPTAAASTSSAWAAGTSSCWPRSSTRTPRTTSRPAATTTSTRSRGCPNRRWTSIRHPSAFGAARMTRQRPSRESAQRFAVD